MTSITFGYKNCLDKWGAVQVISSANVKIVEQAQVGLVRGVNKHLLLGMVFFTSIFISILLAFGFEYFGQTFKSPQDIEMFLNIPFLGSIPKRKTRDKLLITANPKLTGEYFKSYQNLSDQLYLLMRDNQLKTILFTDTEASKDTPVVIVTLGIYLAHKTGHKVLIMDANLRVPSISKILNIPNESGLSDVLEGKRSYMDTIQALDSNLYVMPAGKTEFNPTTLLDSSIMSDLIKQLKEGIYEAVFINCADFKNFTDAIILSSYIDGVILVINEGKVKKTSSERSTYST